MFIWSHYGKDYGVEGVGVEGLGGIDSLCLNFNGVFTCVWDFIGDFYNTHFWPPQKNVFSQRIPTLITFNKKKSSYQLRLRSFFLFIKSKKEIEEINRDWVFLIPSFLPRSVLSLGKNGWRYEPQSLIDGVGVEVSPRGYGHIHHAVFRLEPSEWPALHQERRNLRGATKWSGEEPHIGFEESFVLDWGYLESRGGGRWMCLD